MDLYKVNNDLSYFDSPYVKNNVFLKMDAEDAALPEYESIKEQLPEPIWDGHGDALACYDYAWRIAFGNLKKADNISREENSSSDH